MITKYNTERQLLEHLKNHPTFHDPRYLPNALGDINTINACINKGWVELQRLVSYDLQFQDEDDGEQWERVPVTHFSVTLLRGLRCNSQLAQVRIIITPTGHQILPSLEVTPQATYEMCMNYIDSHPNSAGKEIAAGVGIAINTFYRDCVPKLKERGYRSQRGKRGYTSPVGQ